MDAPALIVNHDIPTSIVGYRQVVLRWTVGFLGTWGRRGRGRRTTTATGEAAGTVIVLTGLGICPTAITPAAASGITVDVRKVGK
jgi:hypothetical protein